MKVIREKEEESQVFLSIEMETAEVEESMEESYRRLVKKANIPGFRKGKAPRAILEQYIGKESLLEDALNSLLPQAYEKAIKEQEIDAIAQPHIEIAQTDPVVFKATVPVRPTVTLGDYHSIRITPEPVELTDDEVSSVIEQLRHQHATWEPVERPLAFNDLAVLDIDSNVEGELFINRKGIQSQVLPDISLPAPGFTEQLVDMKKDDEKEFKLQLPPDYPRGDLAGKEASFKVKVIEIKEEKLPELNDEFAKLVSPDFNTLDALREQVATNLRLRAEEKARTDFEERVIEAAVDTTQLEFPPVLVEAEIDRIISQQLQQWQLGAQGLETYLQNINKTENELREEIRPLASKRVAQSLVLGKITEEEKIEVSQSEIDAEIENLTKDATENKDELEKFFGSPQARQSIEQLLVSRKTVQRLIEIAKGPDEEVKPDDH